jgi:hypothetical protein
MFEYSHVHLHTCSNTRTHHQPTTGSFGGYIPAGIKLVQMLQLM